MKTSASPVTAVFPSTIEMLNGHKPPTAKLSDAFSLK
jgi:hypothetical protein